jgi:Flp pilus assembly protein TadB
MTPEDTSRNANVSLRDSILHWIDSEKVGHGFKNRSDYIQYLIWKDSQSTKLYGFTEFLAMVILPFIYFGFFMVITAITLGTLFLTLMSVCGIIAVFLSMMYYRKNKVGK